MRRYKRRPALCTNGAAGRTSRLALGTNAPAGAKNRPTLGANALSGTTPARSSAQAHWPEPKAGRPPARARRRCERSPDPPHDLFRHWNASTNAPRNRISPFVTPPEPDQEPSRPSSHSDRLPSGGARSCAVQPPNNRAEVCRSGTLFGTLCRSGTLSGPSIPFSSPSASRSGRRHRISCTCRSATYRHRHLFHLSQTRHFHVWPAGCSTPPRMRSGRSKSNRNPRSMFECRRHRHRRKELPCKQEPYARRPPSTSKTSAT
jgi:hypothetical protein